MVEIIAGDNFLVKTRKQSVQNSFLSNNDSLAVEELDFDDNHLLQLEDLAASVSVPPLLYPNKLVIVHNLITALVGSSDSIKDLKNNQAIQKLQTVLNSVSDNVHLLLTEMNFRPQAALANLLKQNYDYKYYEAYRGSELQKWLCNLAKDYGSSLDYTTAGYLIQKTGHNLTALHSEIQKLATYDNVTAHLIDELVVENLDSSTFDLLEAIFNKRYERALSLCDQQFKNNVESLNIVGTIIWQLQIIAILKTSSDSLDTLSQDYKIHKFPLMKSQVLAKKMTLKNLHGLLNLCHQTDRRIKVDFVDSKQAVLHFITQSCNLLN